MKKIFTFWEPKNNIPDYLKLCMETWNIFLPEYEIIVLDYSNIDKWLGENFFDKTLYTDYSLPKQADAIRCAVLEKHGGIWFDCDTIITSDKFNEFVKIDSDCVMLGKHIGFIIAKSHAKILQMWLMGIKRNLFIHKLCKNKFIKEIFRIINKKYVKKLDAWDFLGNSIIDNYLSSMKEKEFYSIDKIQNNVLPEIRMALEKNLNSYSKEEIYKEFYFTTTNNKDYALENTSGILCLHNSWTPSIYKNMSQSEFLSQNITLAKILKTLARVERE